MEKTMDNNRSCEPCGLTFSSEEEKQKHDRTYHGAGSQEKHGKQQGSKSGQENRPREGMEHGQEQKRKAS